jgi:hypothetical protein
MSEDDFLGPNDRLECEPNELHPLVVELLKSCLGKEMAPKYEKPWTQALETAHQEAISAVVGAMNQRRLTSVRLISVTPDGRRKVRDVSFDHMKKGRVFQ